MRNGRAEASEGVSADTSVTKAAVGAMVGRIGSQLYRVACPYLRLASFLLPIQFLIELPLFEIDVGDVPWVIDKRIRSAALELRVFCFEVVKRTMRTQEHVTGELPQSREAADVIVGDLRVVAIIDEYVARIKPDAADDYQVVCLASFGCLH